MDLVKIYGQQFGSYLDYFEWYPKPGVTGIVGSFEDTATRSNGTGKTTLIMTIMFTLYGEGEFAVIDDLVCDKVDSPDMFSGLQFNHNGKLYDIKRGRLGSTSYLTILEDGVVYGDTKTTITQKNEHIKNLLGLDYSMFSTICFAEQSKLNKITSTEASKTQAYIDKAFNLEGMREVVQLSTKELNKLSDKLKELKDIDYSLNQDLTLKEKELSDEKKNLISSDGVSTTKKSITEIEIQLLKLNEELTIIQNTDTVDIVAKYDLALKQANDFKIQLSQIGADINKLKAAISSDTSEIEPLNVSILEFEKLISSNKEKQNTLSSSMQDKKIKLGAIQQNLFGLSKDKAYLEGRISNFKLGICDTCEQELNADYVDLKLKNISDSLSKLEEEITDHKADIEECKTEIKTDELSLSTLISEALSYSNALNKANLSLKNIKDSIIDNKDSLSSKNQSYQKIETLSIQKTEEVKTLSKSVESLDKENIQKLKSNIENLSNKKSSLETIITNQDICLGRITTKIENVNAATNLVTANIELINITTFKYKKVFDRIRVMKALIEDIFNTSISLAEHYANEFIQQLYPDYRVRIYKDKTKKLEPMTIDFMCGDSSRSYLRLSGGQKVVVNIALMIGLAQTIMERANTKINFICLDEPFESLDEYHRELIKSIFTKLQRTFNQIILISHTPDIHDCNTVVEVFMDSDGNSHLKSVGV